MAIMEQPILSVQASGTAARYGTATVTGGTASGDPGPAETVTCPAPCDADCEAGPVHCAWIHQPWHKPGWHSAAQCMDDAGGAPALSAARRLLTGKMFDARPASPGRAS
jgi:hypothetical protein